MIADRLLSRLVAVRETGPTRWLARCPAHEDRSPSLSIREVDDRVLIHCWAGCDVDDVVAAVGLAITDLFPPRPVDPEQRGRPISRPWPASDILAALGAEITFMAVCAADMARGDALTDADRDRLRVAVARLSAALDAGEVRRAA